MQYVGDYDYDLREKLGQGAFAIVYKGRLRQDPKMEIAVKCIEKKKIPKPQALLTKEIRILRELSCLQHENVVRLLDCKENSDTLFLITEYCNGGDLADYLRDKKTLSEDTIAMFVTQIAGAMEALYAKEIVHRDIKPHNLLLSYPYKNCKPTEIKIKIADFGFARFLQEGVMAATLCGSPMYMAPEVLMSHRYDAKADLWSIGTIVYQCLTGRGPFHADTPHQLKTYYEKNPNLQPLIPSGTSSLLRDLICRLLKRNASDRIEFETFFQHPFVLKYAKRKMSAPVAVPNRADCAQDDDSTDSTSSSLQAVSVSPLSTIGTHTPPSSKVIRKKATPNIQPRLRKEAENDYVMVPGNCPPDHKAYVMDQARAGQLQQHNQQHVSGAPAASVDRPVTLPVLGSAPLPVPTQRHAYEQMQRASGSPRSPHRIRHPSQAESPRSRRSSESSSNVDIGSMTPPNITFAVGTPPNSAGIKGHFTTRQRSNTEGSLGHAQYSPPQVTQQAQRLHSNALTASRSFTTDRPGVFGSGNRLTDLIRRPSFAQDGPVDRNKENLPMNSEPSMGCNAELPSPLTAFPYAQSPPNMEGPVMFVVPELTDETLLSTEHRETLNKLQFVSTLIFSLIELAQARTSPLLESPNSNKLTGCVVFVSEKKRRMEQLVLYIRALHVLSSSLQLAKDEVAAGRLQPSQIVKDTVKELNGFYHTCLGKCKLLKSKGVETGGTGVDQQFLNNTADKLIYEHAIELCQQAALDELFGNPIECVKRYRNAHTLLHSLEQMAELAHDRQLLNTYKKEVEKRLTHLETQGYCIAMN